MTGLSMLVYVFIFIRGTMDGVMKKVYERVFMTVMSLVMAVVCCYGAYGLVTAPAKAKAAQDEIERQLRQAQIEADRKKKEALEAAEKQKMGELAGKARNEIAPEDVTIEMLQKRYDDATEMYVTGIGDSVMLAAADRLYEKFPRGYFDAVFGSSIYECTDRLIELEAQNNLGDVLVLSVGTNSYIHPEDCVTIIEHSGGRPTFWLTTYGVSNDSNEIMQSVVSQYDNAFMIDWESYAMPHPEWILDDHLHPNDTGSLEYAQLISQVITDSLGLKEN